MKIGEGNDELVAAYVTEKTGAVFSPGLYKSLSLLSDTGEFLGAVIVEGHRQGIDVHLSTAIETPVVWTPAVLYFIFHYVFVRLNCQRCTALTAKSNKRARAFLEGLGFVLEGNLRRGYDGRRDALVYGMLRSECRHMGGLNGIGSIAAEHGDRGDGIDARLCAAASGGEDGEIRKLSRLS